MGMKILQRIKPLATASSIKGPYAKLVICERAVPSERVNKPYMNCKQHENIWRAMAANYYRSPVQRDLEDQLFISGRATW